MRSAGERSVSRKTAGIHATQSESPWRIAKTRAGATAQSSYRGVLKWKRFLARKWARELDYRLIKELWAFTGPRIAVRFAYEWHDDFKNWFRSYGNENWEFNEAGLHDASARMYQRLADQGIRA